MTEKDLGAKRMALGKGFNSLLGGGEAKSEESISAAAQAMNDKYDKMAAVVRLKIDDIEPNPHQPRKIFDDEALESLSLSIKEDGVVQPIIVAKGTKPGRYVLIAGERRWRASRKAGLETVPAIIKDGNPDAMLRVALIENIQRADLTIIEEAEAYQSLINDFGLSQEQCAKKVGKDRTTVTNALRLLNLPREIQDDLLEKKLTMGHGRALLSLEDKKLMLRARDIVVKKDLSVRQTEQLCKRFKNLGGEAVDKASTAKETTDADLEYLADSLRNHLRTKVRLAGNSSRGRIEVSYFSAAELERLMQLLGVSLG